MPSGSSRSSSSTMTSSGSSTSSLSFLSRFRKSTKARQEPVVFERVQPVYRAPRDPLVGHSRPYAPAFPTTSSPTTSSSSYSPVVGRRRSSTPTCASSDSRRECLYLLDFISEGGETTVPVGAAFPSRRELTEPAPFSNLDPWPSHLAEPNEVGVSEVGAGRYGAGSNSRGSSGKIWFSGQSRTSRMGTESESSVDSGPSRSAKGRL